MEPVQKKKNKTKRLFSLKKKSNQQNGDDMKNEDQQSKEPRLISTSSEVSIEEKEEVTTPALSVEEDYEVFVTAVPVHNEDEDILNMEEKTETHDGFEWVSNVTEPYLDKDKSVSSDTLDQLAPHIEEGKKNLKKIESSATSSVYNEHEDILNMEEKTQTHYKVFDKALEIPLIHDGFEWVSNVTEPYLDKAKSISSEILDQLAPHVEEGKKHLNQIEYSSTFHEILMDITDKVDQRAADYLNYLIDHFPVVKTPTWDLVQQFKVTTQQLM